MKFGTLVVWLVSWGLTVLSTQSRSMMHNDPKNPASHSNLEFLTIQEGRRPSYRPIGSKFGKVTHTDTINVGVKISNF